MRLLIAIALLFTMTPGTPEVAEAAVHLLVHGDLPHHDEVQHDDGCLEHSCTPLAHHCGCHATMSAQLSLTTSAASISSMTRVKLPIFETQLGRACGPPPLRPPIA